MVEVQTRTVEIISVDDFLTTIEATAYDWYYGFFRVFTEVSMDFFDRDNIKEILVDGDPIPLPT
jgi:hypothetical protein